LQYPFIKKSYVEALLNYVDYVKPDKLLSVGDELDCQQISTYARGTALEFEGSLQKNIIGLKGLLKEFRSAIGRSKPFIMQRSNHTIRIEKYISRHAPAFSVIDAIKIENLLGYNDKDIKVTYNRSLTEVAKGVIMGHGDEGRLYNHAGQTALGLATRTGKNVICGHTHRMGISSASQGYGGNLTTLWGAEVGHLCDLNSSGMRYMKEGHANWQAGFGILYEQDGIVKPELVPFNKDGSFIAEGELWR
jgi:hypothetical protein